MAQKITHWLLITLVLSLGFGQLLRFDFGSIPIYLHDILVICILLLQGPALQIRKFDLRSLALIGTGMLVSSSYAMILYPLSSLLVPSLYALRLIAYLFLYLTLKQSKIKIAPIYFLISGLITMLIGLSQYIFMPDMRWAQYLGWDDHLFRLTLPHFDPTFTAVMLALMVLSQRNFSSILSVLVPIFSLLGILLTYSRSIWLSLVITSLIFIKRRIILLLVVSCTLIATFILPQKFGEGTNLLRTYSITSRFTSDLAYIQKYKWSLLVGRGMNTLVLDSSISDLPNHASGPNNSYLYLLLTTGILGLVGWGVFMWNLLQKSAHKPMLIFFFIASLFNNVMFYPFALLWVLILESMVPTSA